MKFQKYLANSCVSEWRLAYVDYKGLKKSVTEASEDAFLRELQIQLHKVTQFYHQQCATLPGRMAFIDNMINQEIGIPLGEFTEGTSPNGSRNTMKDIKYARFLLKEYHRYCMFLINYQKLNKIAFAKILKKYDKIHDSDLKQRFGNSFVNDTIFMDTSSTDHAAMVQKKLSDIFDYLLKHYPKAVKFHHYSGGTNPRSLAMQYLRGSEKKNDEFVFFRVGCCVGTSVLFTVLSVIRLFSMKEAFRDPVWVSILYMYGGMFIIVLSFFGFSVDLYVWKRFRINYVFIFEFNTNHSLTYKQFTEFAAISLFLWALCLYFTIHGTFSSFLPFQYIPLILIGIYVAILILPIKIFYWTSRKWFMRTLFHIFTPGFRKVTFKDFFIADLLISLTFFWTSLYLTVCFYAGGNACSPRKSWVTPFLLSVPLLIRFVQCCRKMYDVSSSVTKRSQSRDLYNSLKYALSLSPCSFPLGLQLQPPLLHLSCGLFLFPIRLVLLLLGHQSRLADFEQRQDHSAKIPQDSGGNQFILEIQLDPHDQHVSFVQSNVNIVRLWVSGSDQTIYMGIVSNGAGTYTQHGKFSCRPKTFRC